MKHCARCDTSKPRSDFAVERRKKDGLASYCRPCQSEYHAGWRKARRKPSERVRLDQPGKECRSCGVRKALDSFPKNKANRGGLSHDCRICKNARNRAYRAANPEAVADTKRRCYRKHAEKVIAEQKAYDDANRERVREKNCLYALKNPIVKRVHGGARRARVLQQTLPLTEAHQAQIVAIYEEADRLTRETGVPHHVDHDVPLKGKAVCGLHVPWNLRAIPDIDNYRKHNKLSDDVRHTEEVRANLAAWKQEKVLQAT